MGVFSIWFFGSELVAVRMHEAASRQWTLQPIRAQESNYEDSHIMMGSELPKLGN
jgi:hypothetical protein